MTSLVGRHVTFAASGIDGSDVTNEAAGNDVTCDTDQSPNIIRLKRRIR